MAFKRSTLRYGETPEPVTPYQKRHRCGTGASARPACRRTTGA
jgi:type IV secretory pathway TrbF-like protein